MHSSEANENSVTMSNPSVEIIPIINEADQSEIDNVMLQTNTQNDLMTDHHTNSEHTDEPSENATILNEDEETIENIAKDIGIDPRTFKKNKTCIASNECSKGEIVQPPQIASLASEWSDDENELTGGAKNKVNQNIVTQDIQANKSLPECIKNVINNDSNDKIIRDSSGSLKTEDSERIQESIQEPQKKLSSLLNDWEDNDSQDNLETKENDSPMGVLVTEEVVETEQIAENTPEVHVECDTKHENIRSLVRDWEDDDDETKQ
ncbi:uncharacterized protein LOC126967934 isoform X3 [Leptidea sinapis]|nr:uncharacterized protein LOC126967934 isoform X3 [Leptidea sinapis]